MEKTFYAEALHQRGIQVLIPDADQRAVINQVIYQELVSGIIREESRQGYLQIIQDLIEQGAQGVILGCTEIPLLIQPEHVTIPLFDTTRLHAEAALQYALDADYATIHAH
jgi:aspartate racemase